MSLNAPFRIAFDNANEPYTARNALGIFEVSVTPPLSFVDGVLSITPPAWTAYSPTITASGGTFTTVSATGKYLTLGKLTHIVIEITITTNGTAAAFVVATLPNTANGFAVLAGRERAVLGKMLQGMIGLPNSSTMSILNYDNTYPGGNGYILVLSGIYENT